MRTVEVFIVIVIILGAYTITTHFVVLPTPQNTSPMDLRRLALTTLESLDSSHALSYAAFDLNNSARLGSLQIALAASLPANAIYNLTFYGINGATVNATQLYSPLASISNAPASAATSYASTYMTVSSNVTFSSNPDKISINGTGITLYILNCSDSGGWWITGYTPQSFASDFYNMLSPYFAQTVLINSTSQFAQILGGTSLQGEAVRNAVIINTCGEAVPIPSAYGGVPYSNDGYTNYCYFLGQKVNQYNWTWASIAGYPFYYVTNSGLFPAGQNTWGIYGMQLVGESGLNAFLGGIDNQAYSKNSTWITNDLGSSPVYLSSSTLNQSNYYGIYTSPYQTSTRALPSYIIGDYHFNVTTYEFNTAPGGWNAGAIYRHISSGSYQGGFFDLAVTRTPDIRLTALGILCDYQPSIYTSGYISGIGNSRLVVLQLGLAGGS